MVLVCHGPRFIYLKTRKTAGTSVEMALEPFCAPPGHTITERTAGLRTERGIVGHRLMQNSKGWDPDLAQFRPHMRADQARAAVGEDVWRASARITCVRNPFQRAISLFHWNRKLKGKPGFEDFDRERLAFRRWLNRAPGSFADRAIVHIDGEFVATHVVRCERIEADLGRICSDLGLSAPGPLPQAKVRPRREGEPATADYFDDTGIDKIRQHCAWMFHAGGYADSPPSHTSEAVQA